MNFSHLFLILLLGGPANGAAPGAHDWPQFLGPNRNGVLVGPALADTWPQDGPPLVWKKTIGPGFSGPVVALGKLILFHRIADQETVECLDARTGQPLWKFEYLTQYRDDFGFDAGPRATPTVAEGKVYTFGAEGSLHCLDLNSGKMLWRISMKEKFSSPKGFFGMVCSPLLEENLLLLNIGGAGGAGIVALAKNDGQLVWKATEDEASYSSPIMATLDGRRRAVFLTRSGVVVLDPATGAVLSRFPWRARMNASVNAATPVVIGDVIFVSASYDTGAIALTFKEGQLRKVWSSDDALSNHYATSVYQGGFLYGFHGRQEEGPSLRCVEWASGRVRWSENRFPAGTVMLAGNRLLVLLEDGRLLMALASSASFKPLAEAQILPLGVRAYPALADGLFYARSKDRLVCLDLGKSEPRK